MTASTRTILFIDFGEPTPHGRAYGKQRPLQAEFISHDFQGFPRVYQNTLRKVETQLFGQSAKIGEPGGSGDAGPTASAGKLGFSVPSPETTLPVMLRTALLGPILIASILTLVPASQSKDPPADRQPRVQIKEFQAKLRIEIGGELFTEYHFKGAPHVYFYPLIGPGGARMTRDYPMIPDSKGEDHDHPHHRSLWYSHGSVNGRRFLVRTPGAGQIVHDKFLEIKSGPDQGVVRSQCNWIAPDGTVVCTDERTFRVYARSASERLFDFEITIKAGDKKLVLGDTKEGSMALRIAESMRLTHGKLPGEGHIVQSTDVKDDKTWARRPIGATIMVQWRENLSGSRSSIIPQTPAIRRHGTSVTTASSPPIRSAYTTLKTRQKVRAI